jgi:hypothetical protein
MNSDDGFYNIGKKKKEREKERKKERKKEERKRKKGKHHKKIRLRNHRMFSLLMNVQELFLWCPIVVFVFL